MNRIFLVGNLGADAELKTFGDGKSVLNFSVATSESWKNKDTGEKETKTEWHRCKMFGTRAESLAQYLVKGTKVVIEGSMTYGKYEKEGVTHYTADVKVNNVEFAGGKKSEGSSDAAEPSEDGAPF